MRGELQALVKALGGPRRVAKILGVGRNSIHRWINGDTTPGKVMRHHLDEMADVAMMKRVRWEDSSDGELPSGTEAEGRGEVRGERDGSG